MALKIKSIDGITNIIVESAASANNVPASGIVGLEDSDSVKIINEDGKISFSAATSEPIDLSEYYKKTETSGKEELSAEFDTKQDILEFDYDDNYAISAINGSAIAQPNLDNYYTKPEIGEIVDEICNYTEDISAALEEDIITLNENKEDRLIFEYNSNSAISAINGSALAIPEIDLSNYYIKTETSGKEELSAAFSSVYNNIAKEYDPNRAFYPVGSLVIHDNQLYQAKYNTQSGEFNPIYWNATNVANKTVTRLTIYPDAGSNAYPPDEDMINAIQARSLIVLSEEVPGSMVDHGRPQDIFVLYDGYISNDGRLYAKFVSNNLPNDYYQVSSYYPSPDILNRVYGPETYEYSIDLKTNTPGVWTKSAVNMYLTDSEDKSIISLFGYSIPAGGGQDYVGKGVITISGNEISADLSDYYTKSETSGKTELTNAFNNKMNLFQAGTDLIFLQGKLGVHTNGYIGNSNYAFVQGIGTSALGAYTHAEGQCTVATNNNAHSDGYYTSALHQQAHTEGSYTLADGSNAHAEGTNTYAHGHDSHAEGGFTTANNFYAHAEGTYSIANATASHAEGYYTSAIGNYSHAEGYQTSAVGEYSHAEGHKTSANGNDAHAEGNTTYSVAAAHAEGYKTSAMTAYTHAEGEGTVAASTAAHSEGSYTFANGKYSHAEGARTIANGLESHSEGYYTSALADYSHAEGLKSISNGAASHSEGSATSALGNYSHSEGYKTLAKSIECHAEGYQTSAIGSCSHTEGYQTYANGSFVSHAQGYETSAIGGYTFAAGLRTIASYTAETVIGKYNLTSREDSPLFVVGNGTTAKRSDAFVVTTGGNTSAYDFIAYNGNRLSQCYTGTLPTIPDYVAGTGIVFSAGTGEDTGKTFINIDTTNYKLLTTAEYDVLTAVSAVVAANSSRWVLTPDN